MYKNSVLCQYMSEKFRITSKADKRWNLYRYNKRACARENQQIGLPTRSDTNQAVQPQKMARGWKFRIQKVEELYYPYSENIGADLRLFSHMQIAGFLVQRLRYKQTITVVYNKEQNNFINVLLILNSQHAYI